MKKILVATTIALFSLTPFTGLAQTQSGSPGGKQILQSQPEQQSKNQQIKKRQWKQGGKYSGQGSILSNYSRYNLKAPPKGHRWVRDGDDFVLIATSTGIIASIVSGGTDKLRHTE